MAFVIASDREEEICNFLWITSWSQLYSSLFPSWLHPCWIRTNLMCHKYQKVGVKCVLPYLMCFQIYTICHWSSRQVVRSLTIVCTVSFSNVLKWVHILDLNDAGGDLSSVDDAMFIDSNFPWSVIWNILCRTVKGCATYHEANWDQMTMINWTIVYPYTLFKLQRMIDQTK